ncbi:thioesterase family protein [Quisquiliibacterium transsilvanicum]|uniref:Acyl-CoA thioesterase n=1 Tax=Quisquiliibacterium transsilvanicum TaxID=1549638 RepID=A0A7W8HJS7_9BURK|nr:thioesterase family protein [Quisquiliibacterium transsilvanicum]MBB5273228.1 acyl-CoA thioesterase [Quisquiliibacterium transsilvanicum]
MSTTDANSPGTPTLTGFSLMMAGMQAVDDGYSITLPDDWLQGRTAYGGLSAAVCLEATRRAIPDLPPLRSAQFAFIGPATGALRLTPRVLRQGKSAVFASADLEGDSGLAVRSTLCFGAERASNGAYEKYSMPATPPLADCPSFYTWPERPNFMDHFEGRLAGGGAPMSSHALPEMLVWLRHRDASASDDLVRLVALADALPPVAFASLGESAPISTMTWAIDMFEPAPRSETGWWLLQGIAETIQHGYSAQTTVIWSPDGQPVLSARQNVAIFGRR